MSEEVVYNVVQGPRKVDIYCNWCTQTFSYSEKADEAHDFTTCPWCRSRLKIPRNRLRRINGARPQVGG
jgi:predicted nucleic acid binding AN1-type Zn finger protein